MNFSDFGINIPAHKTAGTTKVKCPQCGNNPKHKGRNDLSVNISEGIWKCHSASCGWTGTINKKSEFQDIKKVYSIPVWKNNTELSEKMVKYFEGRGISQFTLRQMRICEGIEWMPGLNKEINTVQFPYFIDDVLVNIKYRDGLKNFKLVKDAKLIFYNLNGIKGEKECIITEGEIDALSYWEIGMHNVVSVPNGANANSNNFQYIDNNYEDFENLDKIYIATDTDKPGISLRNELIRRFGAERCFIVEYGKFKDANDLLKAEGPEALKKTIESAKEIKIDGIFTIEDVFKEMLYSFKYGKNRGTTTHIKIFDEHWTHRSGEVTIWTGYNNEGKSIQLIQLAVLKARFDGWKFGVFCPENYPISDYYDDLIHCYVGKSCDPIYPNQMSESEYIDAANFINDHFFVIDPEDDYSIETIIEKANFLVKRKGIKSLIIDPYNQIEHQMERGQREDLYISKFMSHLKREALKMDISVHLVAHQVTPNFSGGEDYPQPDSYKIKGGGTFSDKADNVIIVWRPFRKSNQKDTTVKIIIPKIKKQKLVGLPGEFDLFYSRTKNQYFDNKFDCENSQVFNWQKPREEPKQAEIWDSNIDFDNQKSENYTKETEQAPF
jgi:twinkle protein